MTAVGRYGRRPGRSLPVLIAVAVSAAGACSAPDGRDPTEWAGLLAAHPCAEAARSRLAAWGARPVGPSTLPGPGGVTRWRLPTDRLGRWIVVDTGPTPASSPMTLVSAAERSRVAFDGACGVVVAPGPPVGASTDTEPPAGRASLVPALTDRDLAAAVLRVGRARSEHGVVVYVWSPHMPLSVDGYRQVAEAARDLSLALEPVLFPDGDRSFAVREARRAGMPEAALRASASVELVMRDAFVHAPTVLVFASGRVSPALPGYRDAEGYRRWLARFLAGTE